MALKGTLINTVAILAGTLIGLLVGNRYPEKMKQTVMSGLGPVSYTHLALHFSFRKRHNRFWNLPEAQSGVSGQILNGRVSGNRHYNTNEGLKIELYRQRQSQDLKWNGK